MAAELFRVMAAGGRVGFEAVAWFNGGLFDDGAALPLEAADIETVLVASDLDWSEIACGPGVRRRRRRNNPELRAAQLARALAQYDPAARRARYVATGT